MVTAPIYDSSVIKEILPQRSPFLFVDRVTEITPFKKIIAEKDLSPDELFFGGHFPGRPLMPGVLVSEALAQTSGLLLGLSALERNHRKDEERPGFMLAQVDMKFLSPAEPDQTLRLESVMVKSFSGLHLFEVAAFVGGMQIAKGRLSLAEERE